MKGVIRSTVRQFVPDANDVITVTLPWEQMHIFEVQLFFPAGCKTVFQDAPTTTGADGVFFNPQTSDVYANRNPIVLRNHPDFKRSDQLTFKLIAKTPENNAIVALISYIDK